jgi:hypothetical protein
MKTTKMIELKCEFCGVMAYDEAFMSAHLKDCKYNPAVHGCLSCISRKDYWCTSRNEKLTEWDFTNRRNCVLHYKK